MRCPPTTCFGDAANARLPQVVWAHGTGSLCIAQNDQRSMSPSAGDGTLRR